MRTRLWLTIMMLVLPVRAMAQAPAVPTAPVAPPAAPAVSTPRPVEVTEPRLPTNPQSPTDFQGPVRVAPGSGGEGGTGEGGGGEPAGPEGYSGGDFTAEGGRPELYGGSGIRKQDVPRSHTVQKGDTLWNLCSHYYGDPWSWPQIWAYNKKITNPHWIYPGDQVRLLPGPTVSPRGERQESIRLTGKQSRPSGDIQLRQNGFADPKELEQTAGVSGSKEERLMLSESDEIYIEGNDKFTPKRGQSYSIYRVRDELKNADGKVVGNKVEILGTAQVKEDPNKKKVARAVITESLNPIERGDRVGVLRRRFTRVAVRAADKDLAASVVATMRDGKHVATEELVFVDKGRNQGVQTGNRFLVLRQGDGYKRLLQDEDDENPKYPREAVAELTVIDVRDDTSVALVTRAIKEIRVGDKAQMKRGY